MTKSQLLWKIEAYGKHGITDSEIVDAVAWGIC